MAAALLELDHVTVAGAARPRLDDATVSIATGLTVVVGPSGAGKSTLLRCLNRLEAPTAGTVRFHGEDVATLDARQLRRRVGMVFQRPVLFPGTVRDNLLAADRTADDAACVAVLAGAGLDAGFLARDADELSGGEAQRACLARALLLRPEVLLADEPTSSLDGGAARGIEEVTRRLVADGTSVIWVTHDLAQARRLADAVIAVEGGRVTRVGLPEEILADGAAT